MEALATNSTPDECATVKASNVKNPKASTAARRVTFSPNTIMNSIVDDRIKRILEDTLGSMTFCEELSENERVLLLLQAQGVVDYSWPMEAFVLAMQRLLVPYIDLSRDMVDTLYNNLTRFRREEQIKRIIEDTLGSVTFREELTEYEREAVLCQAHGVVSLSTSMEAFVLAMQAFGLLVPCINLSRDMAEALYNSLSRLRDEEEQVDGRDRAAADGSGSAAGGSVAGSLGTVVRSDASSTLTPSPDRASVGVQAVVNDPPVQLPADAILEDPSSFVAGEPGMLAEDAGGDKAPRGEDDAQESLEGTAFVGSATSGSTGITNPQQARNSSTPNDSNSLAFSRSATGGGGTGASTLHQEGGEA